MEDFQYDFHGVSIDLTLLKIDFQILVYNALF